MLYEMRSRFRSLFSRYYPTINYDTINNIVASIGNDPEISDAEKLALNELCQYAISAGYTINNCLDPYVLCEDCDHMVSGEHSHCEGCNKPTNELRPCGNCEQCCEHHICNSCNECADEIRQCGDCEECCNHSICDNCSECTSCACGVCDNCENCCSCSCCDSCGRTRRQATCRDCSCCSNCCECEDNNTTDYGNAFTATTSAMLKEFNCKRTVGIEWEYNSSGNTTGINAWAKKWRGGIHEDGSCGMEAVTAPLSGDYITNCLSDLGNTLKNATCDERCGIHVHVDVHDFTWNDMYRLLKVYAKVEPLLYLFGGQHRMKNRYCQPVGQSYKEALESDDKKENVLSVALYDKGYGRGRGREAMKHAKGFPDKKSSGRYRGLNICPWLAGKRGSEKDTTVEFRIHRNSLNTERVIGWAKLCARIVDWSSKASDRDIDMLPRSSLRALCNVIAPDLKPWMLNRIKAWRQDTPQARKSIRRISIIDGEFTFNNKTSRNESSYEF